MSTPTELSEREAFESAIDEFIEDYEMRGESDDSRDACYAPTEGERILIKDAIMGLLSDDAFCAAWNRRASHAAPPADPVPEGFHDCRFETSVPLGVVVATAPPPDAPARAVPEVWIGLAERCLRAMRDAIHYGETGQGRPPQQTCRFEAEELASMLAAAPQPPSPPPAEADPFLQTR